MALSSGYTSPPVGGGLATGEAVVVDPDDKVVVAGTQVGGSSAYWSFARFTAAGAADATFGTGGVSYQENPSGCTQGFATAITRQADGKYLVAGRFVCGGFDHWALARYNADGSLDTSFSTGPGDLDGVPGLTYTNLGGTFDASMEPRSIAVHGTGFVLGGYVTQAGVREFAVARFGADGQLDTTFSGGGGDPDGVAGVAVTQVGTGWSEGDGMVLGAGAPGAEPIIVVGAAGGTSATTYKRWGLARYTATGSPDLAFGTGGNAIVAVGDPAQLAAAADVIRDPTSGKIIVGGYSDNATYLAVGRFSETTGAPDTSFDGDGLVTRTISGTSGLQIKGLARRSDGRIYAAGHYAAGSTSQFLLVRLLDTGAFDPAFGGSGLTTTSIGDADSARARGIALQSTGKPVLAGFATNGGQRRFVAARYKDDALPPPPPPDTTKPVVTVTTPSNGTSINDTTPLVSGAAGTAPGDSTTVTVRLQKLINGTFETLAQVPVTRAGDRYATEFSSASYGDGTYLARVSQEDAAGNVGEAASQFIIDAKAPTLTVGFPQDNQRYGVRTRFSLSGTSSNDVGDGDTVRAELSKDTPGGFVKVRDLTGPRNGGSWSVDLGGSLDPGRWFARIYLADAAGNEGNVAVQFYVDPNAAPTVTVTRPAPNASYVQGDVVTASVQCTDKEDPSPRCDFPATIDTSSPGAKTFRATATDRDGLSTTKDVAYTVRPRPAAQGIRVQAIEITQGTQTLGLPVAQGGLERESGIPFDHPVAPYQGVTLVEKANTAVRVFATATRDARVLLYGFTGAGKALSTGPLSPVNVQPPDLSAAGADVKRTAPAGGYTFDIPVSWVTGKLRLVATVIPTESGGTPTACDGCNANNAFALKDIAFTATQPITIRTVKLKSGNGKLPSTSTAYKDYYRALNFIPGANSEIKITDPWAAEIDVSSLTTGKDVATAQHQKLLDWVSQNPDSTYNVTMGTSGQNPVGMTSGLGKIFADAKDRPVSSVATDSRPLTDVAHELFHALGRQHASTGCGGDANGQKAETWTDARGQLLGIGLDFLTRPVDNYGLVGNTSTESLDFMSYCAADSSAWLSPRNWNAVVAKIKSPGKASLRAAHAGAAAGTPGSLHVSAYTADGGPLTLSDVSPGADNAAPPGDPSSALTAVVRNAGGAVIASAPLSVEQTHVPKTRGVAAFLAANVPGGLAGQSLALVANGQVLATRVRSANAPKVALVSPRRGQRVRGDRDLVVRWQATDADHDALTSRVDYSIDNGRTWDTVSSGIAGTSVGVPGALLAGASRARVRVVVNDGWNETAVVSAPFLALGSPPHVTITDPAHPARIADDGQLALTGQAADDRRRDLTGRSLTWFVGRRKVGSGATLSVTDLPPGAQTVRLVARDASGRTGSARQRITVKAVAPTFLHLDAPRKVSKRARAVTLTIASSLKARFTSGRTTAAVGRKAGPVRVAIKAGQAVIRVTLRAHGKTTKAVVTLKR